MRDENAEKIAEICADERFHYPTAIVQVNAPLALIQLSMKVELQVRREWADAIAKLIGEKA